MKWLEERWRDVSAPTLFVGSFLALIGLGTAGLWLLPGLVKGPRLDFVESVFTITSAVCVTGLSVIDVSSRLTLLGQAWLLLFVELGGLGLVTLTTLIIAMLGRRLSLRSEMIVAPGIGQHGQSDLRALAWTLSRFVLSIQGVGAVALYAAFVPELGLRKAVWPAFFHSISAFNNAGFSIFHDGLAEYARSPLVLLIVSFLVVLGGIGYLSLEELIRWGRVGGTRGPRRLSSHTFAVVAVTISLLFGGMVLFAIFEWRGVLAHFGLTNKLVNAWMMSVTARTSGFHTVPYSEVSNATAYFTILLMIVGGSPGSTAGGIKTTSLAVLIALAAARMKGRRFVELHDRTLPEQTVTRTVSLVLVFFAVLSLAVFWLSFTETAGLPREEARAAFLPVFFETASAFTTTGLSMDHTHAISPLGRLSLVVLMFVGRVGPLTFFAAISLRGSAAPRDVRAAREDVIVG